MQHEEGNRQRPQGELLLRTVAMPRDTNPNQDIFGGWIMSQMDLGGGILAAEIARGRIVTVAVQEMNFIRPVKVGNVVCCYGHCVRVGNTSLQLKVDVWVKTLMNDCVTEDRYLVPKPCSLMLPSMRKAIRARFRKKATPNWRAYCLLRKNTRKNAV